MNTQQLHCFLCVADKLNFTKAAEELHLAVPTVTHHIQRLEEELDVKLFVRTSRMVRLTEAGRVFYSDAEELLRRWDASGIRARDAVKKGYRFLHIGCTSRAEADRMVPALAAVREACPNVCPRIYIEDYFRLRTLFENEQLDLMMITGETARGIGGCRFHRLKAVTEYALVPERSPFAGRKELSILELRRERLILLHPKLIPLQYGSALQESVIVHSRENLDISCSDWEGAALAEAGYGIAILPEFCIPECLKHVRLVPLKEQGHMEYGAAYRKEEKRPETEIFIENLR